MDSAQGEFLAANQYKKDGTAFKSEGAPKSVPLIFCPHSIGLHNRFLSSIISISIFSEPVKPSVAIAADTVFKDHSICIPPAILILSRAFSTAARALLQFVWRGTLPVPEYEGFIEGSVNRNPKLTGVDKVEIE
jgi:hypothetical protein